MQSLIAPRRQHYATTRRHARAARPLDVLSAIPDERTAAAMDDADEAKRLIEDLVALVDAGLVMPVDDHGQTRYAPVDPDFVAA